MPEWKTVSLDTPEAQRACLSWFRPVCDEMTPVKVETFYEKGGETKARAIMVDEKGIRHMAEITFGSGRFKTLIKLSKLDGDSHDLG